MDLAQAHWKSNGPTKNLHRVEYFVVLPFGCILQLTGYHSELLTNTVSHYGCQELGWASFCSDFQLKIFGTEWDFMCYTLCLSMYGTLWWNIQGHDLPSPTPMICKIGHCPPWVCKNRSNRAPHTTHRVSRSTIGHRVQNWCLSRKHHWFVTKHYIVHVDIGHLLCRG